MLEADEKGGIMQELTEAEWQARIEEIGEDAGYYERLGPDHAALFKDEGPVLLVSFEIKRDCLAQGDNQMPKGLQVTEGTDWSSLVLLAEEESWFRAPQVYAYFDRLVDDAFFEDFDRVVFYGAGSCGYAAAAYSVAAPGASLLAVQPQATLDPSLAGWDSRFVHKRRTDFTTRYGFAPDMIEGIGQGYVIFDPTVPLDAMHAALFARPGMTLLPTRWAGEHVARLLRDAEVLDEVLERLCAGNFTPTVFHQLWRKRRDIPAYLRGLSQRLGEAHRTYLDAQLCRAVISYRHAPWFRKRLPRLTAELEEQGITLPEPLGTER